MYDIHDMTALVASHEHEQDRETARKIVNLMDDGQRKRLRLAMIRRDPKLIMGASRVANQAADYAFTLNLEQAFKNGYVPKRQQEQTEHAVFAGAK